MERSLRGTARFLSHSQVYPVDRTAMRIEVNQEWESILNDIYATVGIEAESPEKIEQLFRTPERLTKENVSKLLSLKPIKSLESSFAMSDFERSAILSPKSCDSGISLTEDINARRRVHISNIPFAFKEKEIKKLLQAYGEVVDAEVIYNERGSKGFGFATMKTIEEADKVLKELNGKVVAGRIIEVNRAIPKSIDLVPISLANQYPPQPNQD